jgi:glycosyltransferase involved in cell wall biosynthesis
MSALPLVSVTIVTYNQKEYLKEAIESVLAQTYENLEIIVADDCSTDGSQALAKEYQNRYPGKFVLKFARKNMGVTANCNEAHNICTGKYVAWFAGDDLMKPEKIKTQVEFLEKNPDYNIVYHNLRVFDSATGKHLRYYNGEKDFYTGYVKALIKHGPFNGGCSNMVRRMATPVKGFDRRLPVASDWFFFISHLINGGKIGYINEVLGGYRIHESNVTNASSPFSLQAFKDHLETCNILLAEHPEFKKEIRYRLSGIYRDKRNEDYHNNLVKSLRYNPLNFKSALALAVYHVSFNRIKI